MKILKRLKIILLSLFVLVFCGAILAGCQAGASLKSISIENQQTEFYQGADFSAGDLVVTAHYSDGTKREVQNYQIDSSDYNKNELGKYTIVCSYTEGDVTKTKSYDVEVVEPYVTSIEVVGQNLYFDCGTPFSFGEGSVKLIWVDGWKQNTHDYEVDYSNYNANVAGEYEIFILCDGYQTSYTVSVMDETYIESVTVAGQKTRFSLGQDFVFMGTVTISYINDRPDDVVEAARYEVNADAYKKDTAGTYEIVVSVGGKVCRYNVEVQELKNLRVLMIGNSYSDDTAQYLPQIAAQFGFDNVEFGVLYIGGCSIAQHYQNSSNGSKLYDFRYYHNNAWDMTYGGERKSLEYGIKFKDWDFITLQQSSVQSGIPSSYGEDLDKLIEYVKNTATNPNMQLVWNMTWAYADTYENMQKNGYSNQISMYTSIAATVKDKIATNNHFVAISPTGTAVQNARTKLGDTLNRDGTHLSYDVGRYIAAMTMFCTLTGYSVDDISFTPSGLDLTTVKVAKDSVKSALANKFQVTTIQ